MERLVSVMHCDKTDQEPKHKNPYLHDNNNNFNVKHICGW